jgi:hypothetical protein
MTLDDEVARYREAARLTLEQLDWCVMYLHSIRKGRIARALAQNKAEIARRLDDDIDRS